MNSQVEQVESIRIHIKLTKAQARRLTRVVRWENASATTIRNLGGPDDVA